MSGRTFAATGRVMASRSFRQPTYVGCYGVVVSARIMGEARCARARNLQETRGRAVVFGAEKEKRRTGLRCAVKQGRDFRAERGLAYQPTPGRLVCLAIWRSSSQTVRPVFTSTSDIWNA